MKRRPHLVRVAFAALLLLAAAPLLSTAGDRQAGAGAAAQPGAIPMPAGWLARTREWLRAGQIRDQDLVAYGEISELYLGAKPDLYTTAWVLQIADELHWPLTRERRKAVGAWIETLRNPDGSYRDPAGRFPELYSTLLAVRALRVLGRGVAHASALRAYLLARQGPDGLFYDPGAPVRGPTVLADALATTHTVLQIFQAMGAFPAQTSATRRRLLRLGASAGLFADDLPGSILQQGGLVLDSLRLLGVTPGEPMPVAMWRHWTRHWMEQLLRGNAAVDGPTVTAVARLLAIAGWLGIDAGDGAAFRRALTEARLANGGYGFARGMRSMEPQVTALTIDIFRHFRQGYPRSEELAGTLQAYQVVQGWRSIVEQQPDLRATFYAVSIAGELGLDLPTERISRYLRQVQDRLSQEQDPSAIVSTSYYLAATYKRLGLNPPRIAEFRGRLERALVSMALTPDPHVIETMGRGMAALNIVEGGLAPNAEERFRRYLASLRKPDGGFGAVGDRSDISVTYYVLLAADVLHIPDMGGEATVMWLRSLQAPDGGFRRYAGYPFADMDATYHAVAALALAHASAGDADRVQAFVERARFPPFGFSTIPADSPFMKGFSGVPADLRTTYDALAVLRVLRQQDGWAYPP